MKIYRTELHGHIIEARQGDLGCDRVLVDGRLVSTKRFGGWYGASHFLEIEDEQGKARAVEVGWIDRSGLGLYARMRLTVDGVVRAELKALPSNHKPFNCPHCGYSLKGLAPENDEIRCPECGRHTPAILVDAGDESSK